MGKKLGKGKILAIFIPLGILLALGIFLFIWFFGANYSEFDKMTRTERQIPGLESGLSPQGICPMPSDSGFEYAMSGYISGEPSRVYLIGETQKYVTFTDDGRAVSSHFGGIACAGGSLYIASGKGVVRVSLHDVLTAENGGAVEIKGRILADLRSAAFCYYFDNTLFIGEFYRPGSYETEESHHISLSDGEMNYGFVYCYRGDASAPDGFETSPYAVISVREQVQGIAVWQDGIALSTSYGLPDSKIFFYENILNKEADGEWNGMQLYILDGRSLRKELTAPCMSEEIFVADGRIYILFESLSNKYKYFVRRRIDSILSISLGDIL